MLGMILGCIPVALVLYGLLKITHKHLIEECNTSDIPAWERRDPNSVEGLPYDFKIKK